MSSEQTVCINPKYQTVPKKVWLKIFINKDLIKIELELDGVDEPILISPWDKQGFHSQQTNLSWIAENNFKAGSGHKLSLPNDSDIKAAAMLRQGILNCYKDYVENPDNLELMAFHAGALWMREQLVSHETSEPDSHNDNSPS